MNIVPANLFRVTGSGGRVTILVHHTSGRFGAVVDDDSTKTATRMVHPKGVFVEITPRVSTAVLHAHLCTCAEEKGC